MSERRHPNVVHRDEVTALPMEKGKHRMKLRRLGAATGGQVIGASLTELAPHSVSFPFHYHCATEEAIYVLSGSGIARIGDQRPNLLLAELKRIDTKLIEKYMPRFRKKKENS